MTEVPKRVLQDKMFFVELIDWQGQPAVKKVVKETTPQTRAERIKNDVYGMEFFADLAKGHPDLKLHVPKVYELTDKYYIREYIEGEPIIDENMPFETAAPRLDKQARLLADIDRIKPYGEIRFVGSSDYREFNRSFEKWSEGPLKTGLVSATQVEQVNRMFESLKQRLEPRIAHGDMSPYKHAYLSPNSKIGLIDFENFTPNAARYFDVAWNYTRLYSFAASTDIPKSFLASFLKYSEKVEHREEKVLIALLQRTFGMQYDAYHDNLQGMDYRQRAAELLSLVLQAKLELLHL